MLQDLIRRYPALKACEKEIGLAAEAWTRCYERGGKLLVCGNGGSCADGDHIVGELMKGFLRKRPLSSSQREAMKTRCPSLEEAVLDKLQGGLPAVSLSGFPALNSAFSNDVDPSLVYAQAVMGLGRPEDILVGISTSGNSKNVAAAVQVAKGLGLTVLGLTGQNGGRLKALADLCICVPQTETFLIQELHLPVYHYLCAEVEAHFFRS